MSDQDEFVPVLEENALEEGSMKLVDINGVPVLLAKVSGSIFAIDNRCPHMSCGLSDGSLEGFMIVCPCHGWRFDLRTGKYEEQGEITLTKYEWKIESGKILVKVEE